MKTLESQQNSPAASSSLPPVPNVEIAVFCRSQGVAAAIRIAAADRRMTRAVVTVKDGGIGDATAFYRGATSPNLVVVEGIDGEDRLMAALEALAEECVTGTKVIVIGRSNDVGLYKKLVDAGVSDYLVSPLAPLDFIAAVQRCFRDGTETKLGRIVAFVGAKGGTGSSTLAHNVALAMAKRGDTDVLLVDLDLQTGTVGLNFDIDSDQGMSKVLDGADRLDDVLLQRLAQPYAERLHLLPSAGNLDRLLRLEDDDVDRFLDVVRSRSWHVVIDLPHMWTGWTRKVLLAADEIVVTATPDLASMRNTKNLVEFLRAARPNDALPRLLLNKVETPKLAEVSPREFLAAVGLETCVSVPFDPQHFGKAANDGRPLVDTAPDTKAGRAISLFARQVGGTKELRVPKNGLLSLAQRVFKRAAPKAALTLGPKAGELKTCESGMSAVEFALIAPVLALGLVATADLGLALYERMTIDHVLRAGAQAAMADPGATQVDKVLKSTLAQSATPANVTLRPAKRYCACPEDADVIPDAAPVCGTTPCADAAQQYVYYRLEAAKSYQPMSLPEMFPAFQLGSAVQVQVR